ncbi:MAG: hypothetical protein HQK53_16785 [Oligoflexia bacterium]|nr:hypothetical protein [Oligoflexia bacterium]
MKTLLYFLITTIIQFTTPSIYVYAKLATIHLDQQKNCLTSPVYEYYFHPQNHLLIKKLYYLNKLIIDEGQLLLHLNLKNFFTLNIDEDDIKSTVNSINLATTQVKEDISFFYQLLFFKIPLKMDTSLTFSPRQAHLPMKISAPATAEKYLHVGSGILYSWNDHKQLLNFISPSSSSSQVAIADADPQLIKKGTSELAKIGKKNCDNSSAICTFTLQAKVDEQTSAEVTVTIPVAIVEQGFFPLLVRDTQKFQQELFGITRPAASRMGMYFEASGLQKGDFIIDYWITLK